MSILGSLLSWGGVSSSEEKQEEAGTEEERKEERKACPAAKADLEEGRQDGAGIETEAEEAGEAQVQDQAPSESNDDSLYDENIADILSMDEAALDEELDRQLGLYSDSDSLSGFDSAGEEEGDDCGDDDLYTNDASWLSSFAGNTRLSSILKSFSATAEGERDGNGNLEDDGSAALNALRASVDAVSASVDEFTAEISVVQRLSQSAFLGSRSKPHARADASSLFLSPTANPHNAEVEISKNRDETSITATADIEQEVESRPSTAGRVDFKYSTTSLVREAMEGMCEEDRAFHVERAQRERDAVSQLRRFQFCHFVIGERNLRTNSHMRHQPCTTIEARDVERMKREGASCCS